MQPIPYTLVTSICTVSKVRLPWWKRLLLWVFGGTVPETYDYTVTLKAEGLRVGDGIVMDNGKSLYVAERREEKDVFTCRSYGRQQIPLEFNQSGDLFVVAQFFAEGTRP